LGPIDDRVGRNDPGAAPAVGAVFCFAALVLVAAACGGGTVSGGAAPPSGPSWYLSALGVPAAPSADLGRGQVIAVLDTGLDSADLPSLAGRLLGPWNQISGQPGAVDDNGHGTEVTVVAAGGGDRGTWGLAPGAEVMPIKVADADGQANPKVIASAIARAVRLHATVINLSLATEIPDPGIAAAVAAAEAEGVVVVAAAGDASEKGPQFPASEPGVVAAYAQDRSGLVVARFNRPAGPAAMAPGIDVGALIAGPSGMVPVRVSGTSVAAAIVSGLLADCLSAQAGAGVSSHRAIPTCESRMVRSPEVAGFLNLKLILEVSR
jgi:subtilisin family serine protease